MFEHVSQAPPDAILGLNEAFRQDASDHKVNLTVGVFKDETGNTPILECVKRAERHLLDTENSKGYLGIGGAPDFGEQVRQLLLADANPGPRAVTLHTPGGTGALRVAGDLLAHRLGGKRIWLSTPTWANHPKVFAASGLETESYCYLDASGQQVDFAGMCDSLRQASAGDVVCLHGCCHNPTGVDLSLEQWQELATLFAERQLLPLVDCAYQGFGNGLDVDVAGLRAFVAQLPEVIICSSFSKNFGLYGERVGALTLVAANEQQANAVFSHAKLAVRVNYSNPPKHGAAIVHQILTNQELRSLWEQELAAMRTRILDLRQQFVAAMKQRLGDDRFDFIGRQQGMFSNSGLTPVQVDELRQKYSIYIVGNGRINVAGINSSNLDYVCDSIAAVIA